MEPRVASVYQCSYQRRPNEDSFKGAREKSERSDLTFRGKDFFFHFPKHHSKARLCFLMLTCELSFHEQPVPVTIACVYKTVVPDNSFQSPTCVLQTNLLLRTRRTSRHRSAISTCEFVHPHIQESIRVAEGSSYREYRLGQACLWPLLQRLNPSGRKCVGKVVRYNGIPGFD